MAALIAAWSFLSDTIPGRKWAGAEDLQTFWLWVGVLLLILAFFVGGFARGGRPPPTSP